MQSRSPVNPSRQAVSRRPAPPPPPPHAAVQVGPPPLPPSAATPAAPACCYVPGLLLKGLAVLLLAGFSIALGAAFALPGKSKAKKADCCLLPDLNNLDSPKPDATASVAETTSGDGSRQEEPATPAALATTFDVPKVKPQVPAGSPSYALTKIINREIQSALDSAKVTASPLSGDAEFVRRVHLDLTGRIPSRARVVSFVEDSDPYKRAKLIDELLSSPEFGRHMARIWADMLIKRDFDTNKNVPAGAFVNWMSEQINKNAGWDQIVRDMISASGPEASTPQTFFVMTNTDNKQPSPSKLTGTVGNLFMGIQLQCAECHQHPHTSQWGMNDFWGVAAFFGHTKADRPGMVKGNKMTGPATIKEIESSKAAMKKKGQQASPAVPSGLVINIPDPNDPRKTIRTAKAKYFESNKALPTSGVPYRPHLAAWLTSRDNKYFAPAAVNRVWAHFFARGLVNPIEDMNPGNKPTHPALLTDLAKAFAESKYDLKSLMRAICNSDAYQRTSRPLEDNRSDETLYSRMPVKIMDARVLLDSLAVVTGQGGRGAAGKGREAERSPAGTGGDPVVRFFDTREYDDDATEYSYGIPQILRMMNTNLTASSASVAQRLANQHKGNPEKVLEEIYLLTLSRKPTTREVERMNDYVSRQKDAAQGYAGVMWALLNSAEFVSNH